MTPRGSGLRALALALLLQLLSLLAGASSAGAAVLALDRDRPRVEAWPAVTLLADAHVATLEAAMAAAARFEPPTGAYATLGLRKDPVWLRLPLATGARSGGEWILDIDYAVLNRVDVYLTSGGVLVQRALLGNLQPFSQRPMRSRSHALALQLQPDTGYTVYLRVQSAGALVLPITLNTPAAFHARALDEQMLQGLLTGLGLCLLLYSAAQWIALREPLFLKYALLTFGSLLFSIAQFGIGAQYLWPDNRWLESHVPGLAALMASAGMFLFVERALEGPEMGPRLRRVMRLGAVSLLLTALAYGAGLIDVHTVSVAVSTIGLLAGPMALPGAITRARRGDSVGWYFLVAWAGYFLSTVTMVSVVKGHADVSWWTLHSFQLGTTLDMVLFMRVLGLRLRAVRTAAEHATRERDTLHSMAHTDPLTGLPNRRGLTLALNDWLPHCTTDRALAIYMIDLDGFKQVNDQHGHDAGDELLAAAARRLQRQVRGSDTVARLGGDEFVVGSTGMQNDAQARQMGAALLESLQAPFELDALHCRVGLTIGYVLAPQDGRDSIELLKSADAAMYAGKQGGKGCLRRGESAVRAPTTVAALMT